MIIYITPERRHRHTEQLRQYFALRKRVFCDRLGWVEPRHDRYETDRFDPCFNVYILCIDPDTQQVCGGVRLMPTTGPTLLHSVWADMLPEGNALRSPGIWEATPGKWRIAYEEWEYCRILEGVSIIADENGNERTVRPGDGFILRPGFTGTWQVIETTRKEYVIRL